MMRVVNCVVAMHNLWLVALAAFVCVAGGWVAFELYTRAGQRGGLQGHGWVFLAAVAAGASVWCTHFIAMLAYDVDVPVTYDPILTLVSLVAVISGSGLAFHLAMRGGTVRGVIAGSVLGLAISAMHYLGMVAYRADGIVQWDAGYVAASVVLSMIFAVGAILAANRAVPLASLGLFVLAVVILHFTGMTAVSVTPLVTGAPIVDAVAVGGMAVAVAGVAMLIVATGVASHLIDTEAAVQSVDSLRRMALSDVLTGLPNRASFNSYLADQIGIADADGKSVAAIGIDLDKFKEINDLRGHDAGDQALCIIAARLSSELKPGEFVARIGGDEFAAVKLFAEQRDLNEFVTRLENKLFEPMRVEDMEIATGASIGVSVYPQDAENAARLVGNSDLAMYRAKADMTRAVCFYEVEMDERARERREMAQDLRNAIENNQLHLHYQVQESVRGRETIGFEVLLRWTHPKRGSIPPADFIPLAEETGLIMPIGEWVLRQACSEAASWDGEDRIAVNISAIQLMHVDLPKLIHEILLQTGLPARRLEIEITESSIIQDKIRTLDALRRIKAFGVTVAIDDFGTGYSSLDTLRSFPFDRIKLDRSFMNEIESNLQSRAIIRAVLALGKSLEIAVLAEGVETSEQLALLDIEGCDEAQGYYLGRPQPWNGKLSTAVEEVAA